jgi:16S rRNA G527 N7-methylase RsmG
LRGEKISNSISHRNKYDIVTSRAVAELAELLKIFSTISNSKGKIIIMKKIEGFEKEINNTKNYFSELDFKVKCFIKVDKKKSGKLVILYKRYRLNKKISNLN